MPSKLTALLWRVRPRSRLGSVPARPLDQDLHRAPDEALRALAGAALDRLDQALHALPLDRVRDLARRARRPRCRGAGEKTKVKAPS